MLVANVLSDFLHGITDAVTDAIGNQGLYAVFLLMLIDAVLPAASEVVMVYAGAVASGALAGQSVTLFGYEFADGFPAYVAMATAGTIGYLIGSIGGWALGDYLGRPWLEQHGRWLHLNAEKLDRAERWFDRWEEWAVFLGRVTPVVRSFISVPAGVFRARFGPYVWLTAARLGDLVLRIRRRRLGGGGELGELPRGVPVRRLPRRGRRRRRRRVARMAHRQAPPEARGRAGVAGGGFPCTEAGTLGRS